MPMYVEVPVEWLNRLQDEMCFVDEYIKTTNMFTELQRQYILLTLATLAGNIKSANIFLDEADERIRQQATYRRK